MRPLKNARICSRQTADPALLRGKARILNTGIHVVFRGLEFESDAEIGQKGAFFKGLEVKRGAYVGKRVGGCTAGG